MRSSRRVPLVVAVLTTVTCTLVAVPADAFTFTDDDADGWICVCDSHPSCLQQDYGVITVTATGYYDLETHGVELDSMDGQYNESFFLLVENSLNPSGLPAADNCMNGDYYVVADVNPGGVACGTHTSTLVTRFVGRFLLVAGENNIVTMSHFCPEYRAGTCAEHENGPGPCGSSCNDTNPQSVCINLNAGVTPSNFCALGDPSCSATPVPPPEECEFGEDVDGSCLPPPPPPPPECKGGDISGECEPPPPPPPPADCTGDLNCTPCATNDDCVADYYCSGATGTCVPATPPDNPGSPGDPLTDPDGGGIAFSPACGCRVGHRATPSGTALLLVLLALGAAWVLLRPRARRRI